MNSIIGATRRRRYGAKRVIHVSTPVCNHACTSCVYVRTYAHARTHERSATVDRYRDRDTHAYTTTDMKEVTCGIRGGNWEACVPFCSSRPAAYCLCLASRSPLCFDVIGCAARVHACVRGEEAQSSSGRRRKKRHGNGGGSGHGLEGTLEA
jgi:hypothetical protein